VSPSTYSDLNQTSPAKSCAWLHAVAPYRKMSPARSLVPNGAPASHEACLTPNLGCRAYGPEGRRLVGSGTLFRAAGKNRLPV
jgi:hypothetical protein